MCPQMSRILYDARVTSETEPQLGLVWGIKRSFIQYIAGMPDGQGSATDGAVSLPGSIFHYGVDDAHSESSGEGLQIRAFVGDIRLAGHYGMLFVRVADPWIVSDGATAVLTIDDPWQREGQERMPVARLVLELTDSQAGIETWAGTSVQLTAAGAELFNDVYPEGELLDPLTMVVRARS
jgi:hypothetical protein